MHRPCVEVVVERTGMVSDILEALGRMSAQFEFRRMHEAQDDDPTLSGAPDARLIFTSADALDAHLASLARTASPTCATLIVCDRPVRQSPASAAGPTPVVITGPLSAEAMAGRLSAMCMLHDTLAGLQAQLDQARRQEEAWLSKLRALDEELVLAQQVQQELLPDALPAVAGMRLHRMFAPADRISGDFYDVFRLDGSRVAFALADATGHGVPAALMTALLKRTLRGQAAGEGGQRVLEPDDVLRRLNRDLLDLGATHNQYVAALYAILDERTRELRWARGGIPYPTLIRAQQEPRRLISRGMLLGVVDEPPLQIASVRLEPGDAVILHTDGLDAMLARRAGRSGQESESVSSAIAGPGGVEDGLDAWRSLRLALKPADWNVDDVTVLAIQAL